MMTLHGFSASNYYNIAKYVLLYKEIPFELPKLPRRRKRGKGVPDTLPFRHTIPEIF